MQDVAIAKRGEKLLISSTSRNKVPTEYLSISKNARVQDQTVTKRKGTRTVLSNDTGTENKGITHNKELFVAVDSKFQQADLTAGTLTSKGSIWTDTIVNFVNYGKYTLVFTGIGKPYVYDGSTLVQTTTTCPDVNPIIADKFTGFTFMAGNTVDTENILYISRPITDVNPEYAYDWVGANSETISFDSKILGLKSTLNQLFIFTENRVEYIDKTSLQTIWGVATLISTPIGDGGELASYRSVIAAWDKVFYLNKSITINTVNYASGTIDPALWILTDEPVFKITKYLNNLDADQSGSFGYFEEKTKSIHWFLKTQWSSYNDTVLVYDIENATRTTDTKKFFNDAISVSSLVYAGSSINSDIIQVNVGLDDNNDPIEFEIQDTDINLGTLREKIFSGWITSWGLNKSTNMEITTLIDDVSYAISPVLGSDYFGEGEALPWTIWGATVGGTGIGWLQSDVDEEFIQFDKVLDHWNLYNRGKRIKRKITEKSLWSDFYLDTYVVMAEVTGNVDLSDKF